jgi:hypothetical protein
MSGNRYVIAAEEHEAMRLQRALAMSVHAAMSAELSLFELHATLTAAVNATRNDAKRCMRLVVESLLGRRASGDSLRVEYVEMMKPAFVFLMGVAACAGHEEAPAAQATATASTAPVMPSPSVSVSASPSASAGSSAEPKKYGVQGPPEDNSPEAQRQAALRADPNHGIVSLLSTNNAPMAPWGREDSISPPPTYTTPPHTLRQGVTTVNGRLPPEVVQRIVRQNFGRFKLCYENGLRTKPDLAGRVTVRFRIDNSGAVAEAKRDPTTTMSDSATVDCIVRGYTNLSFPQPEAGEVTVVYPIEFQP